MQQALTLSVSEAAARLGFGKERTYELVRSGRLASIRIGKRNIRIPSVALEDFIRKEMNGGTSD